MHTTTNDLEVECNGHNAPEATDDVSLKCTCDERIENPTKVVVFSSDAAQQSSSSTTHSSEDVDQLKAGDSSPVLNGVENKPLSDGRWARFGFCWGGYDAPEARPWVLMHAIVGICVIHYSIAVSQSILYVAVSVSDSNQRMPALFNVRAGNTQLAVNIMVSIANFIVLPTLGAICDYTRFRYHVGCAALLGAVCTVFITASASQEVRLI